MRFAEIIGQEELVRQLAESADAGRVSHAQLFSGAAGTGALSLAVAYVQYLNCRHRRDGDSCGECPDCRQIAALEHPDLHLVFPVNRQGKKSGEAVRSDDFLPQFRQLFAERHGCFAPEEWYGRLDLGRTLRASIAAREADSIIRKLSYKAFEARYKTVLVWLPETMNEEASNKILKILEEPWPRTLFLFVSERPDRLLATVRSRMQEICVPRIGVAALEAEARRRGTPAPQAERLARMAAGDLLELERLLADGEEEGMRHTCFELFRSLMRLSYNDRHLDLMEWAEEAAQLSREQQRNLLTESVRLLRGSYMLHAGLGCIGSLWGEELAFCTKFAPYVDSHNIEPLVAEMETALAQLSQNGNPTIVFTHFALAVSKMIRPLRR